MAEEKLAGNGIRVIACPANDDMFEIDDLLSRAATSWRSGDEEPPDQLGDFTMVSMGWTNPTPWHTFRELPEEPELGSPDRSSTRGGPPTRRRRSSTSTRRRTASELDDAPALDADMNIKAGGQALRPVGSTSVHEAIEAVPAAAVAARSHPREQGSDTDREDPGAEPRQLLRGGGPAGGGRDTSTRRSGKVKNYQLVNG